MSKLDGYRASYDELPFDAHREMYRYLHALYPEQRFWNDDDCLAFMLCYQPATVVEIGGFDGSLAAAVLPRAESVAYWVNKDLLDLPQLCSDRRYRLEVLDDWAWAKPLVADAVVLSQTVEHFSEAKVADLLDALDCNAVYVDTPLPATGGAGWHGTETAHVLPFSMAALDTVFTDSGWRVEHAATDSRYGFESSTRWYSRRA